MIIDLTGKEPVVIDDDLMDQDECPLGCRRLLDEQHDDLVMLNNGDVVHMQCAIDNRLKWQD